MRPRYEPRSPKVDQLLKAAKELESRMIAKEQGITFDQKEGTTLGDVQFHVQVGGETGVQNQYYSTNQRLIDVEDVKNKLLMVITPSSSLEGSVKAAEG